MGRPERGVVGYFLKNGKPVGVTPSHASPLTRLRAWWVRRPGLPVHGVQHLRLRNHLGAASSTGANPHGGQLIGWDLGRIA